MLVGHTSPAGALAADELAIRRSAAGEIGIGTSDAVGGAAMPSGRSFGTNAERCTVSE